MALTSEFAELSAIHQAEFTEPTRRISATLAIDAGFSQSPFSVSIGDTRCSARTTEKGTPREAPQSPDVRVGRIPLPCTALWIMSRICGSGRKKWSAR